jgi:pimeloyl-ACP methyl ester carboxylesterase
LRSSESLFFPVRGLRYHVRRWVRAGAPKMVLLHGWMDVSASFQFLVDALRGEWDVYAPDWRGYGLTEWGRADCYWFPDYIADLDALLLAIEPSRPVNLVGHSLGGNVAALYAGVRPARVAKLVNLEGFGMPPTRPEDAPRRYARWLDELHERPGLRPYKSFSNLAERLRAGNKRLSSEKAGFLARHWGREAEDGGVVLRGDPAHKIVNPVLYRYDEVRACWQQVTAPVLWVEAAESDTPTRMKLDATHRSSPSAVRLFPILFMKS